jgi:hypothetical protein
MTTLISTNLNEPESYLGRHAMSEGYIPKLTVELDEKQYWALKTRLEYGELRPLISAIVDDLVDMIDTHGNLVVALIAGKKVTPREVIPSLAKAVKTCEQLQEESNGRSK